MRIVLACLTLGVFLAASAALAQRNLKDIPPPDPEAQRKALIVADGFQVNLFASDPQIAKPIQMNWDARGRLWIASSSVYPHIKPGEKANDKILVVEDTNADGRADRTTVFADGLLIPTGVAPTADGRGCYVANSTELVYFHDHDGDGRADRKQIVLSGFGTEDTHHLLHTLRWGPDGCLYMNQSIYIHSHIETPRGVRRMNGGGIWRFRPETVDLRTFCLGFVNPWGHHFDRWGQSFATDGAYGEGINYVFPGAVFVASPGAKRRIKGLNPGSPKHCGLEILSGTHLPPELRGDMITCDFRAHRVCRFKVTEQGSGYASRQMPELIKTRHVAFRPIDVKMGPDGAIYIADWYNPIIQHGEVDFRDPRRDKTHGRIWRITAKGRPLVKPPQLAGAKLNQLLTALRSPEQLTRTHAKLLLKEQPADKVEAALKKWLAELDAESAASRSPEAATHLEHARLEALWAYQNIGRVNEPLLERLLESADHRVRAAAVRVLVDWRHDVGDSLKRLAAAADDLHPRVRVEAVSGLAGVESLAAVEALGKALSKPRDENLDFALWRALRRLKPVWLPEVQKGQFDFGGNVEHLIYALKAVESGDVATTLLRIARTAKLPPQRQHELWRQVASLGGPEELSAVLDRAASGPDSVTAQQRAELLELLASVAASRKARPSDKPDRVLALLAHESTDLRIAAVRAAAAWKLEAARDRITSWARSHELGSAGEPLRLAAIDALAILGGEASRRALTGLAAAGESHATRRQAVLALVRLDPAAAAEGAADLLANWPAETDPSPLVAAFGSRQGGAAALAKSLAEKKLKVDVAKLALRAARAAPKPLPALTAAIRKAGRLSSTPKKWKAEEIEQLAAEAQRQGDPARGESIYRRNSLACMKCHAIGGAGGLVGPDLVSIGASAPVDYLVESLVEPNKKIKENFHSQVVTTEDGQVLIGVPVRSTDSELVLRDAENRLVTVPRGSIESVTQGRSLMPDGTAEPLTRRELVDLVSFLSQLGKVGSYSLSKEKLVRSWQTLLPTGQAYHHLRRQGHVAASKHLPDLSWAPRYSTVAGKLPLADLPQFISRVWGGAEGERYRSAFVRFDLKTRKAGKVELVWNDSAGLTVFVNGKPWAAAEKMAVELPAGNHRVVVGVDLSKRTSPLECEIRGPATPVAAAERAAE